jgi:hypothetical protein
MYRAIISILFVSISVAFNHIAGASDNSTSKNSQVPANKIAWQSMNYAIRFTGNMPSKEQRARSYKVEAIYSNAVAEKGNVAFTCVNGIFSVAIALEPTDFEAFIRDNEKSKRRRTRKVPMFINGKRQKLKNWTYVPKTKILLPMKTSTRNKIYNAAIRQDEVLVNLEFKDQVKLILPKVDNTFAEFGAECGLGKNK